MLRIFVDSGSSIKQDEKEKYNVDIIPLNIIFDEKEYLDGVTIFKDEFYHKLIDEKKFPKTSLPSLEDIKHKVDQYVTQGDDVLIITISSKISGEYNALRLFFEDNPKVRVFDSLTAVGGIRILLEEANRYRDILSVDKIIEKMEALIPRIHIMAIPENLDYLIRGGRLSKVEGFIGNVLKIKPIIGFKHGSVKSLTKKIGLKNAINYIANALKEFHCDLKHSIVASYSYCKKNLELLIKSIDPSYVGNITSYDEIDFAIACHWGPNAFGLIFVGDAVN